MMATAMRADPKCRCASLGLKTGQKRSVDGLFYPHANWYDEHGNLIGWGDLSVDDVTGAAGQLRDHELLIIVSGARMSAESDRAPLGDLLDSAPFVFTSCARYFVTKSKQDMKGSIEAGVAFKVVDPHEARLLLARDR